MSDNNITDINEARFRELTDEQLKAAVEAWRDALIEWTAPGEEVPDPSETIVAEARLAGGGRITHWDDLAFCGAVVSSDATPGCKAALREAWFGAEDDFVEADPWRYGAAVAATAIRLTRECMDYEARSEK